jgi:RNA polymerase sigma-70 factor, ECF subfamily
VASHPALEDRDEAPASRARVVRLPLPENDAALVEALRSRRPGAAAALFERHGAHVRRVLVRVLGVDSEIPDLLHDVFVIAIDGIDRLEDSTAVRAWLTSIAIHSARGLIRKRGRRRMLHAFFLEPKQRVVPAPSAEHTESLRATYRVLDKLAVDERIPFALRFIDGMELTEVARACGVSLATVKRRLVRAQERFVQLAGDEPALTDWIDSGRWRPE